MKKKYFIITLIFTLLTILGMSQSHFYYLKPNKLEAQKYNGTVQSFDSIITNLSLDPILCFYGSSISDFYGTNAATGDYVFKDSLSNVVGVYNSDRFNVWYDTSNNVIKTVVYSKWETESRYLKISDTTNKWQPKGTYLTSFTETDPIWNTDKSNYFTKTQSDLRYLQSFTETDPLFDTKLATKTTSNLTEGSNLYWTSTRFNVAFSGKSTNDLTEGTSLYFTNSRARNAISLTTTGSSGNATYSSSTGVLNIPNYTTPSITNNDNVSRSLNSNYTISSNIRGCMVSYSINATWSVNALLSGSGSAFLEYSINSGSSWITINQVGKSLNLLTVAGSDDMNLTGFIPSTATNTRIRTTSSNMTISYTRGQEILF